MKKYFNLKRRDVSNYWQTCANNNLADIGGK